MVAKLNKLVNSFLNAMSYLGRGILVIIAFLIIADVFSANVLNHSIPWVLEITEYLLVFLTFFGAAWLLRENGHIQFDLVLNHLPERIRNFFTFISSCIGFIVSIVITIFGFLATIEMYTKGAYTDAMLQIPRFILLIIIPIGFLFLTVQFLRNIISFISGNGRRHV
ncbi:TRAP-type C4-dicarboxylate transport system, small permease component [Alteribacillus persepolensis]|uniref:TRAP-type C4-dicarboxylate transport system, small permease component n=1 Tax=Alteribacillus persepolensis TaxID=568899 RepID=A0A1G8JCE9_9BACI|nr:TRAP transporter small permease [Alteribacillus persepolensis]SDI28667.1 TRAP-type C4-dicarboxylate transport system, small permease component [Alteribacillus persepolensis]